MKKKYPGKCKGCLYESDAKYLFHYGVTRLNCAYEELLCHECKRFPVGERKDCFTVLS